MKCRKLCVLNEISQTMWPRAGSCCELEFLESGSSLTGTRVSGHASWCAPVLLWEKFKAKFKFNLCQGKCREREHHQADRQMTSKMFLLLPASVPWLAPGCVSIAAQGERVSLVLHCQWKQMLHPAVNYEIHQDVFCILTAFETPKICFPCVGLMIWLINNFCLINLLFFFWVNKQMITVFFLMTSSYCWPRCYMK